MLAVAKIAPGGHGYYLRTVESLATTRETLEGRRGLVEADGRWLGRGSERLGLFGRVVAPEALGSVLAGTDPVAGSPLDPAHRRVRVAAFDCTFAPAKSVSLLHALGPGEIAGEVRLAHDAAVEGVVGYLDRNASCVRRTRAGVVEVRRGTGFVAAGFVHRTSRGNDPHLHTHVVVANLVEDDSGRWSALDGRAVYLHASTASLLYAASLRHELATRLDIRFASPHPYADIAGVDRRLVEAFSTRSRDIAEELALHGRSGERARALASLRTRRPKDVVTPYDELVAEWRTRAERLGVSEARLARLIEGRARVGSPPNPRRGRGESPHMVELGPFSRRDLVRATCVAALADPGSLGTVSGRVGGFVSEVEAVADAALGAPGLVEVAVAHESLRRRDGGRIPPGFVEAHFATPQFVELTARRDAAIAATRYRLAALGDDRVGLVALATSYRASARCGRRIAALAANTRQAAQFEALTGIPTTTPQDPRAVLSSEPGLRLAVMGASRFTGADVSLLLAAKDRGVDIDFLDSLALEASGRDACGDGVVRHRVGEVDVVVAATLPDLLAAVRDELAVASSHGEAARVVVADRGLAAGLAPLLGHDVVAASSLRGSPGAGRDPHDHARVEAFRSRLLVLGSAAMLGPARRRDDARRAHFVVEPVTRHGTGDARFAERVGWLAGIAQPRHLRAALGALPEPRSAGEPWRRAAARIEEYRSRHGIEDLTTAFGPTPSGRREQSELVAVRAEVRAALATGLRRNEAMPAVGLDVPRDRLAQARASQRARPGSAGRSR